MKQYLFHLELFIELKIQIKNKSKVSVKTKDQEQLIEDDTPTEKVFGFPIDKEIAKEMSISQKEDLYFEK